jgi:mannose-6-phosphate isomerase-like protein (cupin superfamily)
MPKGLEFYQWDGEGFKPLVFSHGWQVALLNWLPIFELEGLVELERHNLTDEIFILLDGKAVLITQTGDEPLQVSEMKSGYLYNVPRRVWHANVATRDVRMAIVENENTHLFDWENRPLKPSEQQVLISLLPDWCS